jgi:hypothetical protein
MIRLILLIGFIAVSAVSSWIVAVRMRRRMQKSLGRKATDRELISLTTWMQVDEKEKREQQSRPIAPS